MEIELTKEQISILNELCFDEFLKMCGLLQNEYIDKTQVQTRLNKMNELLDVLVISED